MGSGSNLSLGVCVCARLCVCVCVRAHVCGCVYKGFMEKQYLGRGSGEGRRDEHNTCLSVTWTHIGKTMPMPACGALSQPAVQGAETKLLVRGAATLDFWRAAAASSNNTAGHMAWPQWQSLHLHPGVTPKSCT